MIVIATRDDLLRARLTGVIGRAECATTMDDALRLVKSSQPLVVLLDVRIGGNRTRAVEQVSALQGAAPAARVAILTPRPSPEEVTEAIALGAYTYADTTASDFEERVRRIVVVITAKGRRIPIARMR